MGPERDPVQPAMHGDEAARPECQGQQHNQESVSKQPLFRGDHWAVPHVAEREEYYRELAAERSEEGNVVAAEVFGELADDFSELHRRFEGAGREEHVGPYSGNPGPCVGEPGGSNETQKGNTAQY